MDGLCQPWNNTCQALQLSASCCVWGSAVTCISIVHCPSHSTPERRMRVSGLSKARTASCGELNRNGVFSNGVSSGAACRTDLSRQVCALAECGWAKRVKNKFQRRSVNKTVETERYGHMKNSHRVLLCLNGLCQFYLHCLRKFRPLTSSQSRALPKSAAARRRPDSASGTGDTLGGVQRPVAVNVHLLRS